MKFLKFIGKVMLENFSVSLFLTGAAVLEGVAGIGKTHAIEEVKEKLIKLTNPHLYKIKQKASKLDELRQKFLKNICGIAEWEYLNKCIESSLEEIKKFEKGITTTLIVMHPSSTYEEMIGGVKFSEDEKDKKPFRWQPGKILEAFSIAWKDFRGNEDPGYHLIVLDEINRCNLASVLGELIYLIEPSRRISQLDLKENTVKELENKKGVEIGGKKIAYPSNLFIMGTMNSSDRSIVSFDQALRRRFPPFRLEPMSCQELKNILIEPKTDLDDKYLKDQIKAWEGLNSFLKESMGPDAMVGHSYWFSVKEKKDNFSTMKYNKPLEEATKNIWQFGILPQVIHSAESNRREQLVHDFFEELNKGEKNFNSFKEREQIKLTKEDFEVLNQIPYTIKLVGKNHGAKLLIDKKPPVPSTTTPTTTTTSGKPTGASTNSNPDDLETDEQPSP